MMRLPILLVCASLFASATAVEPAIDARSALRKNSANNEFTAINIADQQRRKTWDVFGLLLMMVGNGDCGPHGKVHLLDCPLLDRCEKGNNDDCEKLCSMRSHHGKSRYANFCSSSGDSDGDSSSSSSSATADAYQDNATPGSITMGERLAEGFQFWMVAAAFSVGVALVAVHIGQRREERSELLEDYDDGASMAGSVGRRMAAVSALADGVMAGSGRTNRQVEMAEYQLEDSYPTSSFA
eukprot:jgi/Psemu1/326619/estExt_fgenesh1_pg.C_4280003